MNRPLEKVLILNYLHLCVLQQAVLDFHQQVGSVMTLISEQYKELFEEEHNLSEICSQEQMKDQLIQALLSSGRYFTFKEKMEVRTTSVADRTLKDFCNFQCFPHIDD